MADTLQSLANIGPLRPETPKITDPLQAEYEEGKKYLANQQYGQAAVALHNALVGFREKKDETGIANASNQLGDVCLGRDEYANALEHFERALAICEKSNDRMSILSVMKKTVEVRTQLGQNDAAIKDCLMILEHYQDNRDPQGTVTILEKMAEIYQKDHDNDKAADAYRTIASIHKNFRHDNMAAKFMEKAAQLGSQS